MNVYEKLNLAREKFHATKLTKTGENKFAGYKYFELGDFLIPALAIFREVGLCATVTFDKETASMHIRDIAKPDDCITLTSPMGSAALKGCHEVQNIGAVETYQRRYLWVAALEIVEHDALDATTGSERKTPAGTISGPKEAYLALSADWKQWIDDFARDLDNVFEQQGAQAAKEVKDQTIEKEQLQAEHIAATWHKLSSKARSGIDAIEKNRKAA